VLVVVMLLCALAGSESISLKTALAGGHESGSTNPDYEILMHIRVPRVILAAIVGAALAAAGVALQALLRNPLADPYILGISSGAGLGATLAIIGGFSWTLWGRSPVAVFAFVGAVGTVWLVWGIGRITGRFHVTGLLLAGVVVNAFFSAIIMFLISAAKGQQLHATMFWLMGNGRGFCSLDWSRVRGGVVSLYFRASSRQFPPGDARSMGIHVESSLLALVSAFITAGESERPGWLRHLCTAAVRLVLTPPPPVLPVAVSAGRCSWSSPTRSPGSLWRPPSCL
jgi:ABC-type Fe3+-siderophore transport system permease subunit